MRNHYQAEIHIVKQEDGLWRLYVPDMKGAWVDTKTLEEGFTEIQEAIALAISYYQEHEWPLPKSVSVGEGQPVKAIMPVLLEEYRFSPPSPVSSRGKKRRLTASSNESCAVLGQGSGSKENSTKSGRDRALTM